MPLTKSWAHRWVDIFGKDKQTVTAPELAALNGNAVQVLYVLGGLGAPTWYRMFQPAWNINRHFSDKVNVTCSNVISADLFNNSFFDIIVCQRIYTKDPYSIVKKGQNPDIIYLHELDDDLFNLPSHNPCYKDFVANAGDKILGDVLKRSQGVLVSTPELGEAIRAYNTNTLVSANAIDYDLVCDFVKKDNDYEVPRIVLGWSGGHTHAADLNLVVSAVAEILAKYPNVDFHINGFTEYRGFDTLPEGRVVKKPWTKNILEHYENIAQFDIGICPLEDNVFNRGKSSLKYLELAAMGTPAVASNVVPYNKTIEHNKTGILVSDTGKAQQRWVEALSGLIESVELRKRLGKGGRGIIAGKYNQRSASERLVNHYIKLVNSKGRKKI